MDPLHTEGSPLSKRELLTMESAAEVLVEANEIEGSSHPHEIQSVLARAGEILDTVAAREALGDGFDENEKRDIGALRNEVARLETILSVKH